ncbi:Arc family DNA-binding protein [Acetobacter papayae]|uniref:Arc family DNA-binding protein n=1 Tax=Acetobacter papayae TaxID=1076592 RepID=UPI0039ECBF67
MEPLWLLLHWNHGGSGMETMTHSYPQLKFRLPPDVHSYVKEAAKRQERSLNGHIVFLLRQEMEKEKEENNSDGK